MAGKYSRLSLLFGVALLVSTSVKAQNRIVGGQDTGVGSHEYFVSVNAPVCGNAPEASCSAVESQLQTAIDNKYFSNFSVGYDRQYCLEDCGDIPASQDCCACCEGGVANTGDVKSFCSGTLITPNVVMTDITCAFVLGRFDDFGIDNVPITITVGAHDGVGNLETFGFVESTPVFLESNNNLTKGVILVQLNGTSSYTPVALDDGSCDYGEGDSLTILGIGNTKFSEGVGLDVIESSPVLQQLEVEAISNSDCEAEEFSDDRITGNSVQLLFEFTEDYYANKPGGNPYSVENITELLTGNLEYELSASITDEILCAKPTSSGADVCLGDNGGPLLAGDVQVAVTYKFVGFGSKHKGFNCLYEGLIDSTIVSQRTADFLPGIQDALNVYFNGTSSSDLVGFDKCNGRPLRVPDSSTSTHHLHLLAALIVIIFSVSW